MNINKIHVSPGFGAEDYALMNRRKELDSEQSDFDRSESTTTHLTGGAIRVL